MKNQENDYQEHVFLYDLRESLNRDDNQLRREHQKMQLSFLLNQGVNQSSNVLDLGCGPLRLGVALIPRLESVRNEVI